MAASDNPYLFDVEGEEDRTVLVQASKVRNGGAAANESRDRCLLVRIEGESLGQVTLLNGNEIVIGRAQTASVCILDPGVSRHHARLIRHKSSYLIQDMGSANGTYVGGELIDEHELADGEIIQLGPTVMFRYSVTDADQQAMLEHLYDASVTDALTSAHNREYFDTRLASELAYAKRHNAPLSLIMLDIDFFKRVNDTYGHRSGDQVLVALVKTARAALRTEDVFCRYGGEEFAVILRTTDVEQAALVAERIRAIVSELVMEAAGTRFGITVSLGCASLNCCTEPTPECLISIADRRLYAAKHGGRNRVVSAG